MQLGTSLATSHPGSVGSVTQTCENLLALLLQHHRGTEPRPPDPSAFGPQLRQLAQFVSTGEPIVFTLPAFPCKSPNPAKVLGHLPDQGERLSLRFLDNLCRQTEEIYPPGARMLICSDGHVFADVIGVPDAHVDDYLRELARMVSVERLTRIELFGLADVHGDASYDAKRAWLNERYAPTLAELRALVRSDPDAQRLYRGITRFLVEDSVAFDGSSSALQRACRLRAYSVIARSRAWGDLVADHHRPSVRLSIHPQTAGSAKFGIRLVDSADVWVTPWHSCAVRRADRSWGLVPRAVAERSGTVVIRNGRPDHVDCTPGPGPIPEQRTSPGWTGS